ncbi:hypothetical protein [Mesorhizobium sp. ES1-1]|uniref:hypothetical protein n=1 Tax=Mesorhizobium sp. ES1-1 TaxID=2876629 RepID=UPI001CCE8D87|nr:hypothetical protein [Mesorhizobium sp. ES1-1]MBZ9675358.1 hypothetical protein [Mesorhizobium sp. ES1-1]
MPLRGSVRVTLALWPLLLLAVACMPQEDTPKAGGVAATSVPVAPAAPGPVTEVTGPQPRTAAYVCANGGRMTIENLGASIRVVGPDGVVQDMPASPANQNSRFGQAHDAIVIDGREALVMKGGSTPVTCTR